jgi:chromosomal replication initiator protein
MHALRKTDLHVNNPADRISAQLARKLGVHRYRMWFGDSTKLQVDGENVRVSTDSQFVADWIHRHFAEELRGAAREALGAGFEVQVRVAPELFEQRAVAGRDMGGVAGGAGADPRDPASGRPRGRARHRATPLRRLSDFIVGPSNRLAYSAACRLAEDPDGAGVSPLFIYGGCGLGKTHLLQGICARCSEVSEGAQAVRYVTGEQFTNDYITAVRSGKLDAFRAKIRKLDLLAIDDIHFLSNKIATQGEFLHTIDAIDLTGARIVLASDEHPRHIKRFSQSLISRFLSGMVVKVDSPDRATRIALIRRLSSLRGLKLNDMAAEAIAARCVGSVREIEGAVTKLAAMRLLGAAAPPEQEEIGLLLTQRLFDDGSFQPSTPVRIATVIDVVCEKLGVNRADLMGACRHQRVVLARGVVAHLSREMTTLSYPEIARALGRTFHSTVHTAANRLRRQLADDETVAASADGKSISVRELVDQLRHQINRATSGG